MVRYLTNTYYTYFFVFYFVVSCNFPKRGEEEVRYGKKSTENFKVAQDTIKEFSVTPKGKRETLSEIFLSIPEIFLQSPTVEAPNLPMRNAILNREPAATAQYRDIVADTTRRYLFYYLESRNTGILTSIKDFPYTKKNGALLVVDVSVWNHNKMESENTFFIERNEKMEWIEVEKRAILPEIRLQDFYNKDNGSLLKEVDHDYMPFLCFELPPDNHIIKVFLGKWLYGSERFDYKPDRDFVTLLWINDKFEKAASVHKP